MERLRVNRKVRNRSIVKWSLHNGPKVSDLIHKKDTWVIRYDRVLSLITDK